MSTPPGSGPGDPWWYRALEPLRSEAAMFRVLCWVVAVCALIAVVVVVARNV